MPVDSELRSWIGAVASIFLILLAFPSECPAQEAAPPSGSQISSAAAAPFAGCYELHLGRWWPWGMGDDTKFATPPPRIELKLQHGAEGFEQNGLLIRAIPPGTVSRRASYWLPQPYNRVVLIWTSGFSGVSLRLHKNWDDLGGWAHAFFDFPRPPHVAHVKAKRIACESGP
jgi:hypothetical protein